MAKFLSGRKPNLKLGITDHTVNDTVLQTIGKVGIGITNAGHYSLYVNGATNITGDTVVGGGLTVTYDLDVGGVVIGGGGGQNTQIGDDIVTRNFKATGITTLATASISDLTPGSVVLAGAGGQLEDDSNLTYDGYTLNTGNLIGVGATFSGNVSIAGTLTYEDVTNVDAVGLVTAREGIRIPYDNKMLQIGLGDDLQLYHDSQNSYIKDNGTGSLRILGGNTTFMNAAENKTSATFNVASSVDLYNNNVLRLQTTGYGVTVYNTLRAPQLNITGVSTFAGSIDVDGHTELDNVNISGVLTAAQFTGGGGGGGTIVGDDITTRNLNVTGFSTFAELAIFNDGVNVSGLTTLGGHVHVTNGNIKFFTSRKAIFGDNDELEIRYTGSASQINDASGELYINTDNIHLRDTTTAATFLQASVGAGVTSFFNGLKKFETTNEGVKVTGVTSTTDLYVTGISTFGGLVSAGGTTGTDGQYLRSTGVGVTWSSFPTMRTSQSFTATEGQTTFNFTYNVNLLDVFLNGVKLTPSEYTASNGSTVVLNSGCFAGDTIDLYSYNVASTGSSGGPGPAGPAGPAGSKGQKGEPGSGPGGGGSKGQKGEVGSKGQKGQTGADNSTKGQKGEAGSGGAGGQQGSKGQKGTSGAGGQQGSKGQKGEGGISGLTIQDEGSALSTAATTLNFVGAGVTASGTGATKTITISGGGGGGSSTTIISPVAYAVVSADTAGTGTGMSWGAYNSTTGQMVFTFDTAQPNANYYVHTNREYFATHNIEILSKTTTGFTTKWTNADTSLLAPSIFKGVLIVYASTPTISVGGGSGTGGLFEQTSVGINTSSKVGIGTTNPMFDLDVGSYVANNVSTASTIRIIGENNSTAIRIGPGGTTNDITLIRVDSKDGTTDGSGNTDLGHSLKYMGSGSGADNRLAFWVDNTSNTAYEAVSIYNDGKFVVDGNPSAGGHGFYGTPSDAFTVRGSSQFDQINVTGVVTATSFYGDGSNLTGISGGIGANESINTTGIITASSFYGDASNLTGIVGTGIGTTGGGTYTTNSQGAEQIDSLPLSIKTAEYALFFENASGIQAQKLMVMHDGTTAYSNESAIMFSANQLVSVGATISGGNLLVKATPEFINSGLSTYRFTRYELM